VRILSKRTDCYDAAVPYAYTPEVLEELAAHGLVPGPDTSPQALRDALRDLYKYEIKVLKARLLAGEFPKPEYAGRVIRLRRRYPLLSVPVVMWVVRGSEVRAARGEAGGVEE
jgi:hypothetical protein